MALALALQACSSGEALLKAPAGLVTGTAGLVTGTIEKIGEIKLPEIDKEPTGSPTEIYTRIARGMTVCWLGSHGQLKGSHILHAEAAPPSRGGRAEIVIHERDTTTPNPRGNRAFRVLITPSAETAVVESENARFPLETGQRMSADVRRWGRGDLSCSDMAHTKGWEAQPATPEPSPPAKPKAKGRERQT